MIDLLGRLKRIMNKDAAETFDQATDSLEALSDKIDCPPASIKTGSLRTIPNISGGVVLHSGEVLAATVKSLSVNSGEIYLGGRAAGHMPYSGCGYLIQKGEAVNVDIDDFGKIRLFATVSGDRVTFAGTK